MTTDHTTPEPTTPPPAQAPLPPLPGRDRQGRFTKGNPGGPGNPFARRVAALRAALLDSVTEDDIHAIAARLLDQAKQGDVASARLLFGYTLGKPAAAPDPDSLDVQEWELLRQSVTSPKELKSPFTGVPVGMACTLHATTLPVIRDNLLGRLGDALEQTPAQPTAAAPPTPPPAPSPPPAKAAPAPSAAPPPAADPVPPAVLLALLEEARTSPAAHLPAPVNGNGRQPHRTHRQPPGSNGDPQPQSETPTPPPARAANPPVDRPPPPC